LKATLARMSKGESTESMFALLASLPSTVLDDDARQAIVHGAQTSESLADTATKCTIREALAHLIRGSSVKVNL
jgi:adenylosuccinate lyase